MTAVDWYPLADRNPVPGDAFNLQQLATHFARQAETIRDVITGLGRIDAGDMESEAVRILAERREDVAPRLELLACRYEKAGQALHHYCPALEEAQDMAGRARRMARTAQASADYARRGLDDVNRNRDPLVPTFSDPLVTEWTRQVDDAEAQLAAAHRLLDDATELRDRAADLCADALDDAADDDLADDDSRWGAFTDWAGDAFDWVVDNFPSLKDISTTLGYAAAAIGLLSLVFPPLAVVAAGVGAVKLGIDIRLAATNQGAWTEVAWGAIGLATFGVGRVFTSAARGTAGAAAAGRVKLFEASFGRPGALGGLSGVTAEGTLLRGAALRSYGLKHYPAAVQEFGTEAANILPRGRHWVEAATRWRNLELPGPELVSLSRRAVQLRNVTWVASGLGAVFDGDQVSGEHLKKATSREN